MKYVPFGTDSYSHEFALDLDLHTWMIGQSGVGKSTAMTNGIIQLLQDKDEPGIGLIDPHGPAADKCLRFIPRHRMKDVVYFNLHADAVPAIIPQYETKKEEELFKNGVVSMLKSMYRDRWGDETERIIQGGIDAVTEYYGYLNVFAVYLFLARDSFRAMLLDASKNPLLHDFRQQYDEKLRASDQMSRFSAPLNKWDEFVRPTLRVAMSNEKPIDFLRLMNDRRILIVRVAKGEIGEEAAKLAGQIIVLNLKIAALRRKEADPPFHLFIDECQNFLGGVDFETFSSEMRKYKIPLFLVTQYLDHFPSLSALFGNFPNGIIYRVSGRDAKTIEENFLDEGLAHQIVGLSNYEFVSSYVSNNIPRISGVITCKAKVRKLGGEPPRGAVIAESLRRWSSDRVKNEAAALKFLTPPERHKKAVGSVRKVSPRRVISRPARPKNT